MKIRIDGGVVVGWSGTSHELIPNGSVLIDGDRVVSVGADKVIMLRIGSFARASSIFTFTRS